MNTKCFKVYFPRTAGMILFMLLATGLAGFAQQKITVTGTLHDEDTKEPLIGAGILYQVGKEDPVVAGVTNATGNFKVEVPPQSTLIFRYIGYSEKRLKLRSGETNVNVTLSPNRNKLDETVVIGYQKKTRALTTGSSIIISGEELQDIPVSNVEQLLQGRVAGLNIQNNTGSPGARGFVAIRGLSNIQITGSGNSAFLTPTSPLYVIDGVPVDPDAPFKYGYSSSGPGVSPLSMIPPEDIKQIEVLKDAQATALYGSRGAYGVILISTVRGSSPIPLVRYTGNFFISTPPELRSAVGGNMERRIRVRDIFKNGSWEDIFKISRTPFLADSLNPYYNNSTNWQSIFYQTTYNMTHNINISGGDPRFNYKANLGYYHQNGVIKNTGFDRYSISANSQYKPSEKLRVFNTFSVHLGKRNLGSGSSLLQKGVSTNGQKSSLFPGPSFFLRTANFLSAVATKNNNKTLNLRVSTDIKYQLLPGLSLGSAISYNYESNTQDQFTPAAANGSYAKVYGYDDRKFTLYNRNTVTYFHSINESHNFTLNLFNEIYNKKFQAHVIRQEKIPNDQYQGPLGYDAYYSRGGGLLDNFAQIHTASFAGMFSYNYKQKYVFNATYRMDGVSSSGFENPYSKNPSLGVRWNFSKENLFENSSWLSYGSLRATWGKNIVPQGDLFMIYGTYVPRGTYNGNSRIGIDFDLLPNPHLEPTTTTQYDIGFESGLFHSRIDIIFDFYYKEVKNLLRGKDLAVMTGFNKVNTNETSLVDYGYELTLTFHPLPPSSKLKWSFSVNGAYNRDILTHLPNDVRQLVHYDPDEHQDILYHVGRNSLSNYLYVYQGVYPTKADVPVDPATGLRYRTSNGEYFRGGDPIWKDKDGNYILTGDDRSAVGNSQPLVVGGLQSYLTYNNVSLNISASYIAIRDILNNAVAERLAYLGDPFGVMDVDHGPRTIVGLNQLNYWKRPGDKAVYPNPFDYTRVPFVHPYRWNQTLFQEDGSYFKINTVTLAYKFEKSFAEKLGLRTLRVYLSCNNLATFSAYSGPNPENVSALGRDQSGGYPIPRTWNVGVNVDF